MTAGEARLRAQGWILNRRGNLEPPSEPGMKLSDLAFSEALHRQDPSWGEAVYDDMAELAGRDPGTYAYTMGYLQQRAAGGSHEDAVRAGQLERYGRELDQGVQDETAYNRRMAFLPLSTPLRPTVLLEPGVEPAAAAPPVATPLQGKQLELKFRGDGGRFASVKGVPPAEAKRAALAELLRSSGRTEEEVAAQVERLAPLETLREHGSAAEGPLWPDGSGPDPNSVLPEGVQLPPAPPPDPLKLADRRAHQLLGGAAAALLATYGLNGLIGRESSDSRYGEVPELVPR